MIREDHESYARYLHLFLSPFELDQLHELAVHTDGWVKGRQNETYFKLDIKSEVECGSFLHDLDWLNEIGVRARAELRTFADRVGQRDGGQPAELQWDAYLLYYPSGAYIPYHKDPAPEGFKHLRLNAVVTPPTKGGVLNLALEDDSSWPYAVYEMTTPGDAVVFSSSDLKHHLSTVIEGSRLVLSFGCLVPR